MKNPNAVVAWIVSHAVIGAEQLVSRYFGYKLPGFWEQEAIADTTTVVLLVGREGVKVALQRAWQTCVRVWNGPPAVPPSV